METQSESITGKSKLRRIVELLGLTCALIGLGLWIPSRWKLYGIYPLVLGGFVGISIHTLVRGWIESRGLRIAIALVIAALVWNGQHLLAYQRYLAAQKTIRESDPAREWGITSRNVTSSGEGAAEQKNVEEFQTELTRIENVWREKMSFSGYLGARAKPLGVSGSVGAWGLYLGEMVLGLVGCLIGLRWRELTQENAADQSE